MAFLTAAIIAYIISRILWGKEEDDTDIYY